MKDKNLNDNFFSKEKFHSLLKTDPDFLSQLFTELVEQNTNLFKLTNEQQKTIEMLESKIKELEAHLNKNSHNSSKPPSSDGLKKKTKSLRKKSGKMNGGQKGHHGKTLKSNPKPDIIETIKLDICPNCSNDLSGTPVIGTENRQVTDVKKSEVETIEYQAQIKECGNCNSIVTAKFPENVNSRIQYGENLKAYIVYFRNLNFIPTERAAEIFEDIFGVPLSEGTIYNTVNDIGSKLAPFEKWIKEKLLQSSILHFDETGIRIEKKLHWIHNISNEEYTFYAPHKNRGEKAIKYIGILPAFNGNVVHDYWKSYLSFENCSHSLCNAHHLRELTFLYEEEKLEWAGEMIKLLLEIKEKVDKSPMNKLEEKDSLVYENRYDMIVQKGSHETPPPEQNNVLKRGRKKKGKALCLLERFRDKKQMILAFMHYEDIPFDNNQAERDIRMAKLYQKISGCFRTFQGAETFLLIRSYLSTVKKQGMNIIDSIVKLFHTQDMLEIFG